MRKGIKRFLNCCMSCGLALGFMTSCDPHQDVIYNTLEVGNVVCSDGDILKYEFFKDSGKTAVAVVFYVNTDENSVSKGYAVCLNDVESLPLADSLGLEQGTSADVAAMDGEANTYALYKFEEVSSPVANKLFGNWLFGQNAFLPSAGQMRALYQSRSRVNHTLELIGGEPFSDADTECWYWTSTEVENEATHLAWLYSMQSGMMLSTPKDVAHKSRPIIDLRY